MLKGDTLARAVGRESPEPGGSPGLKNDRLPGRQREPGRGGEGMVWGYPLAVTVTMRKYQENIRLEEWGPVDGASAHVTSEMGIVS